VPGAGGRLLRQPALQDESAHHRRLLSSALWRRCRNLLLCRHHPELSGLGGRADHRLGPGVLGALGWHHRSRLGHGSRHLAGAGLCDGGGHAGGGLDRLHPDGRAGCGPVFDCLHGRRPGGRSRQGDRPGACQQLVQILPREHPRWLALVHCRGHHHDVGLHSPARRVSARDVGQGCGHGPAGRHHRRLRLPGLCLRADVHRGLLADHHAG